MKHLCIAIGLMLWGTAANAQEYPNRPLKMIVPFAQGSAVDYSTRFHAEKLSQLIGQPVVVENRPGANGTIGVMAVKDAPADGYTLLAASNSPMTVHPWTVKNLPYDPIKGFRPICGLFRGQVGFVVPGNSSVKSIKDLVAAGTGRDLMVGTYAAGYTLFAHLFASQAGVKMTIVPYKGLSQAMTDVLGGRLDLTLVDLGGALPFAKDGRVQIIGVSGEGRNSQLPDVPAVRESFPGYSAFTWVAFYARAEVPDAHVKKLAAAMQKILETSEAKEFVLKHGAEQMPLEPAAMAKYQLGEYERLGRVAQAAGIKPE